MHLEALESREVPATFTVDTPLDVVNPNDNVTSLREAVNGANAQPGGGQHLITFAGNLNGQVISLNSQLTLEKNIFIAGPGSNLLTVQPNAAAGNIRLFEVAASSDSIIAGLKLRGGKVSGYGGAILNNGSLTVTGCIVRDSEAGRGGGIATSTRNVPGQAPTTSTLTLYETTITSNRAAEGGGLAIIDGYVTASNSVEISNNTGVFNGGGVFISRNEVALTSHLYLTGVSVTGNETTGKGGGIYCLLGSINMSGGSITFNFARDLGDPDAATEGGGVYLNTSSTFTAVNGPLIGNNYAKTGDGMFVKFGALKEGLVIYVDDSEYNENVV